MPTQPARRATRRLPLSRERVLRAAIAIADEHRIESREVLSRHSWAIGLVESRTRPGPANLRHHDSVLGILRGAGFSSAMATRAYNMLNSYIYGFVLQEMSLPFRTREELADVGKTMLPQISGDEYPHLRQVAADLMKSGFVYANEFEVGLDLILDGIAKRGGK